MALGHYQSSSGKNKSQNSIERDRERDKKRDGESEHVHVYLCASCLRVAVVEAMFTTSFPLV